ncbi:hypothetical protein JTB14_031720 [Gonioctena quinquepunctata]|nr:hypothetical protein JTB14_031720 [Gonioctena quinquepunctata]
MDTLSVIEETLKSVKCHFCQHVLSFPPILISFQDEAKNKCGRCKALKKGQWVRNLVFESVAQHLSYPCIHCDKNIPWAEVEKHELSCKERAIPCPFKKSGCELDVVIPVMESHFKYLHPRKVFYDKIVHDIDLNWQRTTPLLLIVEKTVFIVYLMRDAIFVGCLEKQTKFSLFNVEFTGQDNSKVVKYKNQKIVEFDDRLHCYECMKDRCDIAYHPYSNKYTKPSVNQDMNSFNLFSMISILNAPTHVKVTLTLISSKEPDSLQEMSFYNVSNLLRSQLECPVCTEYLVGPIFACRKGHGLCRKCKLRIQQCPSCETEFEGSRCYQLENLAENIQIVCSNNNSGCNFVGNLQQISLHESVCDLRQNQNLQQSSIPKISSNEA